MSDYGPIPQKNVVKDCGDYECVRVCVSRNSTVCTLRFTMTLGRYR